jgi:hypothetical protein
MPLSQRDDLGQTLGLDRANESLRVSIQDFHEFVFRFNLRWQEDELFAPVLCYAIGADPLPYSQLKAEPTG